jgi:hypothetical protein
MEGSKTNEEKRRGREEGGIERKWDGKKMGRGKKGGMKNKYWTYHHGNRFKFTITTIVTYSYLSFFFGYMTFSSGTNLLQSIVISFQIVPRIIEKCFYTSHWSLLTS